MPASFPSRVTFYAPGPGDPMEGGFETSRANPLTGELVPSTLDDVRLGRSPFVTLASDPRRYGETISLGQITYRSPLDNQTYTLPSVTGYVHDTGSAFRGRPDKLDVAVGDFRGWSPGAASAFVQTDAGRRMVQTSGNPLASINAASQPTGQRTMANGQQPPSLADLSRLAPQQSLFGALTGIEPSGAALGYLAGALQGGNLGQSISRGLAGGLAGGQQDVALRQEMLRRTAIFQSLQDKGYSQAEALAGASDPKVMEAMLGQKYPATKFEAPAAGTVAGAFEGGRFQPQFGVPKTVETQPGGGVSVFTPSIAGAAPAAVPGPPAVNAMQPIAGQAPPPPGQQPAPAAVPTPGPPGPQAGGQLQELQPGMSPRQLAAERKGGQIQAEAQSKLPGVENDTQLAISNIDSLLKHPGLKQSVGVVIGNLPAVTAAQRDFTERLRQVGSAAWSNAVQTMRGLGALSNAEGARLESLRVRLSRAKSEADFTAALEDGRDTMRRGLIVARKVAAGQMAPPYPASGAASGAPEGELPPIGSFMR